MTKRAKSKSKSSTVNDSILIKGAREHNLKDLDVTVPRNQLVVFTGLSGSGKSTLAFDTIYAEGRRKYVESLSVYARQFVDKLNRPDLDSIEGLCPSVSIEQRVTSRNPRSTVGTITEIYDYFRLLFCKAAEKNDSMDDSVPTFPSVTKLVQHLVKEYDGQRVLIMSPIVRVKKGSHKKAIDRSISKGYLKARIDGKIVDLEESLTLEKNKPHTIDVIIDRLIIKRQAAARIEESITNALEFFPESIMIYLVGEAQDCEFRVIDPSQRDASQSMVKLDPRMFSFNSPLGACPTCKGLGFRIVFDQEKIIGDKALPITEAVSPSWLGRTRSEKQRREEIFNALAKHYKIDLKLPYYRLSEKEKAIFFNGTGNDEIQFKFKGKEKSYRSKQPFVGIIADLEKKAKNSDRNSDEFLRLRELQTRLKCSTCGGSRLKVSSLAYQISGFNITQLAQKSISQSIDFFKYLKLGSGKQEICKEILNQIQSRLEFLERVGLSYISIDRAANTLSGGETQRVHLATQMGSTLTGVLYVLDEPSIGLHQRDNEKLIDSLSKLKENGNSVIVVEHDRDTIKAADYVFDMGPGAGEHGGKIVAQGTPREILASKESITGSYLKSVKSVSIPSRSFDFKQSKKIRIEGCTHNNLQTIDAEIPLGALTCVTGVSGSGKSSLIIKTLIPALKGIMKGEGDPNSFFKTISGGEHLDRIIQVDQSPIGRSPRSNPATYSGVFNHVRDLYANTRESKIRGYKPGRFSFNVKGGRCEACEGAGVVRIEMRFLPDVFITCSDCNGLRYNRETLMVRYRGKNISEALDLSIEDAVDFFNAIPKIVRPLQILNEVGLGYIRLGQPVTTLSGGEAQRMKLAKELIKRPTGKTLYVLDEPSTGLHFADIERLLYLLDRLVRAGNSIIVIEHNMDIIKNCDHVIDLGPDGGDGGGEIICTGTPQEIVDSHTGYTAQYLEEYFR